MSDAVQLELLFDPPAELLLLDLGETVAANFFRTLYEWPRAFFMPPEEEPESQPELELDEQDPKDWAAEALDPVDGMPREHP